MRSIKAPVKSINPKHQIAESHMLHAAAHAPGALPEIHGHGYHGAKNFDPKKTDIGILMAF